MARSTQLPAAAWAKLKKVRSWSEYTREGQLLLHTVYADAATGLRVKRTTEGGLMLPAHKGIKPWEQPRSHLPS